MNLHQINKRPSVQSRRSSTAGWADTIVAKTPMNTLLSPVRSLLPAWLAVGVVLGFSGCHAVDFYDASLQAPVPPAMEPPRELSMVSLPSYRVEPPDILQIEMLKLVPLPPYRIDIYDVLQIRVLGTMLDQPIDGFFLVEGEGIVTLGPAYGRVRVAGMTVEEASEAITRKLQEVLSKPDVSVQLARTAGTQPVTGQYLIGPDGTINLRQYGAAARWPARRSPRFAGPDRSTCRSISIRRRWRST